MNKAGQLHIRSKDLLLTLEDLYRAKRTLQN
jgi:hypothetical protein